MELLKYVRSLVKNKVSLYRGIPHELAPQQDYLGQGWE